LEEYTLRKILGGRYLEEDTWKETSEGYILRVILEDDSRKVTVELRLQERYLVSDTDRVMVRLVGFFLILGRWYLEDDTTFCLGGLYL